MKYPHASFFVMFFGKFFDKLFDKFFDKFFVLAGLVPAIHALLSAGRKAWPPGTSPGVTACGEV